VRVRLVAPLDPAVVRLVRRVHVTVLLAVARVGEPAIAALELAGKGLFTWKEKEENRVLNIFHLE